MKQTNKVDWLLLLLQFKEMLLQQTVEVVSQLSKLQRVRQNKSCDIYGNAQVFSKPGNRNAFLKMPSRTELLLPDCNMALIDQILVSRSLTGLTKRNFRLITSK